MELVPLVTVACSALSWMLPMAGPQAVPPAPAPQLTVSFPYRKSGQEERIWLKCSPKEGWRAETFYFYRRTANGPWIQYASQKANALELSTNRLTKQTFACSYLGGKNARSNFQSLLSNWVEFSLTESPPTAILSLDPHHPFYIPGQEVTLTCSAADGWKARRYTFYKKQPGQPPEQLPHERTGPSERLRVGEDSTGLYSCTYWILLQGGSEIQSRQSNIISIAVRQIPVAPKLSVVPQHSVYTQGERFTLICSAPAGVTEAEYYYYKKQDALQDLYGKMLSYITFGADEKTAGNYSCAYSLSLSGQQFLSSWSSFVSVAWAETPAAANLSLSPWHSVYIQGENITLTCSAPAGANTTRYTFYRKEDQTSKELQRKETGPSEAFGVDENTAGNYSCAYWLSLAGREIQSDWSSFVSVAWADSLPPPVLKVDPPSRLLTEGDPLLLSCSANGSSPEKRFSFSKDGAEMTSSSEESLRSSRELGNPSTNASVSILQAEPSHTGAFACRYEEKVSGRWILSPWSQKVNITVSAKLSLEYTCFALVLLLAIIPLGVYCWRKRNGTKQKSEPGEPEEDTQGPQAAALQEQGSEVTYALLNFPPAAVPSEHEMENRLQMVEMEKVVYSDVRSPSKNRAAK